MKYTYYLASAYGTESYGTQQYACSEGDTVCLTSASGGSTAGNPNTGLFAEPLVLVPVLAAVAIAVVVAEFVLRKFFRKRKATALASE